MTTTINTINTSAGTTSASTISASLCAISLLVIAIAAAQPAKPATCALLASTDRATASAAHVTRISRAAVSYVLALVGAPRRGDCQ